MAEDKTAPPTADEISPKLRKRLDDLFKFGVDKLAVGEHDYAHSMYSQCVAKDPSNLKYVEAMLSNLNKKWASKKGKCKVKESRSDFKKGMADKDWIAVFKAGPDLLKDNPWDVVTLRGMAEACEANRFNEVELQYLKNALEANPKDVEINRHCASSLTRMGQFDQAIACWARIEEKIQKEARTKISELQMAKNRRAAGITDDDSGGAAARPVEPEKKPAAAESKDAATGDSETEQRSQEELEQAIIKNPEEVANYMELASLHTAADQHRDAEQVLRRAMPVSGGSLNVQEELEKTQLRRSRSELAELKAKAGAKPSEEMAEKLTKAKRQNLRLELDVYGSRAERYPEELRLRYEVGIRMKKLGNFEEAIPYFEQAEGDAKHAAAAMLSRGECLQQIKQYTAALKAYEQAVETTDSTPADVTQLALYRAGTLAIGLKDSARAKNWLEKLLEIAPGYRDAAARLDKLA